MPKDRGLADHSEAGRSEKGGESTRATGTFRSLPMRASSCAASADFAILSPAALRSPRFYALPRQHRARGSTDFFKKNKKEEERIESK